MSKFVSIKTVLSEIEQSIDENLINQLDILQWLSVASSKIGVGTQYEVDVCFTPITEYTGKLPKGFKKLIMMGGRVNKRYSADELLEQVQGYDSQDLITILNCDYMHQYWKSMLPSTNPFHKAYICDPKLFKFIKPCPDCKLEYTLNINGTFKTSFKEGQVAIAYLRQPLDKDGSFLIPNNESYISALKAYALKNIWEKKFNRKESGAYERMRHYNREWELFKVKAIAEELTPDLATLENLRIQNNKLISNSDSYQSFFGNLNNHEVLNMTGFNK